MSTSKTNHSSPHETPVDEQERPWADDPADTLEVLREAARAARPLAREGEVARYIPALAEVDDERFALVTSALDGTEETVGDADVGFSVQSIAKVFSLTLAMQYMGERIWKRVGREPSGNAFNSLVQLEHEKGIPRNPLINSGAIVVEDILLDHCDDPKQKMLDLVSQLVGEPVHVDQRVWDSEVESGDRNRAMANFIASFNNLHNPVDEVLDAYFHQSSLVLTPRQLARSFRFLANDGIEPVTGDRILSEGDARRVTAIMLTCGTYDAAGDFAFSVGIPCKSGVGGGIVGVVPDRMAIAAWSPPLDDTGNSLAGRAALEHVSTDLDLSIF